MSGYWQTPDGVDDTFFDVVIVGAGISGINSAYRLQTELPGLRYTILESRGAFGGTWDLFRYPGIRSDSDLYTFGFSWWPWRKKVIIADGQSIVDYVQEAASVHGIDQHVQFHHKLSSAEWSSKTQSWTLSVEGVAGAKTTVHARFLLMGTGYYDYDKPQSAVIPGIENFKGKVVHPQFWPEDLDYTDKKVVIIGSGATAITLLPSLAEHAAHVTMLQRSPSYIVSIPNRQKTTWADRWLPSRLSYKLNRGRRLLLGLLFYKFCRAFPDAARRRLRSATVKQLPPTVAFSPHFEPSYNPWEQRLCVCPDGDFYRCLQEKKAGVVTGTIKTVTETGILLESGQTLESDIIITATGLKIRFGGGASIFVDGHRVDIAEKFLWRSSMVQDIPNLSLVIGYTNASWTLGADATALLLCRLLRYMKGRGMASATPRIRYPETVKSRPVLDLSSTYIRTAARALPKTGDAGPWKPRSYYFKDYLTARFSKITNGLEFAQVLT
jgi:cation diffusion facilitator CzcD-associated flavoprotein CzcO